MQENILVVPENYENNKILNEGFYISGRQARLVSHPDNSRWFLVFVDNSAESGSVSANSTSGMNSENESDASLKKAEMIEVLPTTWLETMLRVANNKSDFNIVFKVWGKITVFQDRNFLFLNMVATESLFGNQTAASKPGSVSPFSEPSTEAESDNPENVGIVPISIREKLMTIPRVEVISFPFKMKESDINTVTIEESAEIMSFSMI